jgi:two-component system, NarL family, response regulator DevR
MSTTGATDPVRVVVVDDHPLIRQGLRALLERNGAIVAGEAATSAEAVAVVACSRPEVVVLDLRLGSSDRDGIELCRRLTTQFPRSRVLVLTTFLSETLLMDAMQAGARGYVLKDVDVAALVRAVADVREGQSAFDSRSAAVAVRSLSGRRAPQVITERERDVVRLVALGLSNEDIGRRLYISQSTVKFHIRNMLRKTGAGSRAELVFKASQLGLL